MALSDTVHLHRQGGQQRWIWPYPTTPPLDTVLPGSFTARSGLLPHRRRLIWSSLTSSPSDTVLFDSSAAAHSAGSRLIAGGACHRRRRYSTSSCLPSLCSRRPPPVVILSFITGFHMCTSSSPAIVGAHPVSVAHLRRHALCHTPSFVSLSKIYTCCNFFLCAKPLVFVCIFMACVFVQCENNYLYNVIIGIT